MMRLTPLHSLQYGSWFFLDDLRREIGDLPACYLWAKQVAEGVAFKINGRDCVRY